VRNELHMTISQLIATLAAAEQARPYPTSSKSPPLTVPEKFVIVTA